MTWDCFRETSSTDVQSSHWRACLWRALRWPSRSARKTGVNSALDIAPTTADFVHEVAISEMFEIHSSKLARDKGNVPEKSFASQMITDHTKTSVDLKELVSSGKVKADLPTALDSSHQSMVDKLKGESGRDFSSKHL
jgi:putative membrane protein